MSELGGLPGPRRSSRSVAPAVTHSAPRGELFDSRKVVSAAVGLVGLVLAVGLVVCLAAAVVILAGVVSQLSACA